MSDESKEYKEIIKKLIAACLNDYYDNTRDFNESITGENIPIAQISFAKIMLNLMLTECVLNYYKKTYTVITGLKDEEIRDIKRINYNLKELETEVNSIGSGTQDPSDLLLNIFKESIAKLKESLDYIDSITKNKQKTYQEILIPFHIYLCYNEKIKQKIDETFNEMTMRDSYANEYQEIDQKYTNAKAELNIILEFDNKIKEAKEQYTQVIILESEISQKQGDIISNANKFSKHVMDAARIIYEIIHKLKIDENITKYAYIKIRANEIIMDVIRYAKRPLDAIIIMRKQIGDNRYYAIIFATAFAIFAEYHLDNSSENNVDTFHDAVIETNISVEDNNYTDAQNKIREAYDKIKQYIGALKLSVPQYKIYIQALQDSYKKIDGNTVRRRSLYPIRSTAPDSKNKNGTRTRTVEKSVNAQRHLKNEQYEDDVRSVSDDFADDPDDSAQMTGSPPAGDTSTANAADDGAAGRTGAAPPPPAAADNTDSAPASDADDGAAGADLAAPHPAAAGADDGAAGAAPPVALPPPAAGADLAAGDTSAAPPPAAPPSAAPPPAADASNKRQHTHRSTVLRAAATGAASAARIAAASAARIAAASAASRTGADNTVNAEGSFSPLPVVSPQANIIKIKNKAKSYLKYMEPLEDNEDINDELSKIINKNVVDISPAAAKELEGELKKIEEDIKKKDEIFAQILKEEEEQEQEESIVLNKRLLIIFYTIDDINSYISIFFATIHCIAYNLDLMVILPEPCGILEISNEEETEDNEYEKNIESNIAISAHIMAQHAALIKKLFNDAMHYYGEKPEANPNLYIIRGTVNEFTNKNKVKNIDYLIEYEKSAIPLPFNKKDYFKDIYTYHQVKERGDKLYNMLSKTGDYFESIIGKYESISLVINGSCGFYENLDEFAQELLFSKISPIIFISGGTTDPIDDGDKLIREGAHLNQYYSPNASGKILNKLSETDKHLVFIPHQYDKKDMIEEVIKSFLIEKLSANTIYSKLLVDDFKINANLILLLHFIIKDRALTIISTDSYDNNYEMDTTEKNGIVYLLKTENNTNIGIIKIQITENEMQQLLLKITEKK